MKLAILILGVAACLYMVSCSDAENHAGTAEKQIENDMYVLHATVYQVGILTNRTDNVTDDFNSTGNQESITFYRSKGRNMDLGAIPKPFLTNITAQTLVGVVPAAPQIYENNNASANGQLVSTEKRIIRSTENIFAHGLFKRDAASNTSIDEATGPVAVPSDKFGVPSISLPFLLSLSNMTNIRVPIPTNTSIVHYTKVNTLVQPHQT